MSKTTTRQSGYQLHNLAEIEALLASIGEGLIVIDVDGNVTRANQQALDIFGYKEAEILGARFVDKIIAVYENGKPVSVFDRPISEAFLTGKVVNKRTIYKTKSGRLVPVQITVSPLLLHDKPIGAVQLFRDISEETRMDKMKSDFISLSSHQLRTPLSAINIYAGMLRDGIGGTLNKQQAAFVDSILTSSHRMNELIDTLLSITRIEAGGIKVTPSRFEVNGLINDIIAEIRPVANSKNIKLKVNIKNAHQSVKTDELLLKEVMVNLLTNAVKYTPEGGKVTLEVKDNNQNVTFSVADNGYGIPKRLHDRVFTKFFRADNIMAYDVSGTGLGLYLTKMIADKLSAELWFESVEGKGTTFYFDLPRHGSIAQEGSYRP
jgi:PAS domain S-box-containing protein